MRSNARQLKRQARVLDSECRAHVNSFRLPLASGFFYPDFVAKLKNGRIFVVEYKGEHFAGSGNDDTNEKRLVGALWEKASSGKGLFAMIEKEVDGRDPRGQLINKIEAG